MWQLDPVEFAAVDCRKGSLEILGDNDAVSRVVDCRKGSLETQYL